MPIKILNPSEKTQSNKMTFLIIGIMILIFAFIIDKEVQLPSSLILPLGVFSLFALLVAAMNKSEISLYVLAAYLPFSRILVGDFGGVMTALNFTNILIFITLLAWVTDTVVKNRKFYTRTSLDIPLLIFMSLGCLSLIKGILYFGSAYASEFIFPLKRWLTPMFLFFLFFNIIKNKKQIKIITIIIMLVVIVAALMAVKDYINVGEVARLEKARIGGILEQPNSLAAFFTYYMFIFAGFMLVYWNNFRYWFLLFPLLACFRAIQVTFSRGGYIAFTGAVLAIAFFRSKILFIFITFFLIFAIVNPQFLPKGIRYRMSSTFRNDQVFAQSIEDIVDKSSKRRIEIWKGAIKMIKDYPRFGVGYGIFPYLIPRYTNIHRMDAHNTYILIAAEMGIPALLVFLLVLLIILKNTRRLYIKTKDRFFKALSLGFLGCLGGVFVANIFGGRLDSQELSSYLWILAALIFKANQLEKDENTVHKSNTEKR